MNKIYVFLLFILPFMTFGQTDTIVLKKTELKVYSCKNEAALDWYLFTKDNVRFTLCNLQIPLEELLDWYEKRGDSQNLYRANLRLENGKKILCFEKPEQTEDRIYFEVLSQSERELRLFIEAFGEEYKFLIVSE
jgi:hypothetical protein